MCSLSLAHTVRRGMRQSSVTVRKEGALRADIFEMQKEENKPESTEKQLVIFQTTRKLILAKKKSLKNV